MEFDRILRPGGIVIFEDKRLGGVVAQPEFTTLMCRLQWMAIGKFTETPIASLLRANNIQETSERRPEHMVHIFRKLFSNIQKNKS
eukprot:2249335-Pyramimonas_sp.AAC.1